MARTRKPKPTDVPEEVLDHFAGPARPMSAKTWMPVAAGDPA